MTSRPTDDQYSTNSDLDDWDDIFENIIPENERIEEMLAALMSTERQDSEAERRAKWMADLKRKMIASGFRVPPEWLKEVSERAPDTKSSIQSKPASDVPVCKKGGDFDTFGN
jgi:hypothetical protein